MKYELDLKEVLNEKDCALLENLVLDALLIKTSDLRKIALERLSHLVILPNPKDGEYWPIGIAYNDKPQGQFLAISSAFTDNGRVLVSLRDQKRNGHIAFLKNMPYPPTTKLEVYPASLIHQFT